MESQGEIEIFECLDTFPDNIRKQIIAYSEPFNKAVIFYTEKEFSQAYDIFTECLNICPEDQVSKVFQQHCLDRLPELKLLLQKDSNTQ